MSIIKRFFEWLKLKEKLHDISFKPPKFSEGDVWWLSYGENIGKEINGKSKLFTRPAIIYKKLSRETFLAIPTSTQIKTGSWFVEITYSGFRVVAVLSQVRVVDAKRLSTKIGQLDETDYQKVKTGFLSLFS